MTHNPRMSGNVLVFVEIQPDAFPPAPFTIQDAVGTATVKRASTTEPEK